MRGAGEGVASAGGGWVSHEVVGSRREQGLSPVLDALEAYTKA